MTSAAGSQEILGHGHGKGEPHYEVRSILRVGRERLAPRQQNHMARAFAAHPDHLAVAVAYQCAQDLREMFQQPTPTQGRRLAERLIENLPSCPIFEIARLRKALRRRKAALRAYFDSRSASNGRTEAVDGIIELGRRSASSTATSSTTPSECSSSPADSTPHLTLNPDDLLYRRPGSLSNT